LNHSWTTPSPVFVLAAAMLTKFSLSRKFSRNLGSMPKTPTHVLLTLGLWSHCIPAQNFVSVKLNHNRSPLILDFDKDVCCHHSSS